MPVKDTSAHFILNFDGYEARQVKRMILKNVNGKD